MKKKIFTLALITILFGLFASNTLSFFVTEKHVHNIITTGDIDIEIQEFKKEGNNEVPYIDPIKVMPNTSVSKIVKLKNLDEDAYVRCLISVVIKDENDQEMNLSQAELDQIISYTMNSSKWAQKDGENTWWYYSDVLSKNDVTEPLIEEVIFDGKNMGNQFQNSTIILTIDAQAVQAANNEIGVMNALGWGE